MKEKVQSILSWEERVSSCTLSTGLPGRCIVVAIPCRRHAWADHHTRFHSQSHSPTKSCKHPSPPSVVPHLGTRGEAKTGVLRRSKRMHPSSELQVVSVNVGLLRAVVWKGRTVLTGIFKEPVAGRVAIRRLNLEGDRQADLAVHA